MWRPRLELLHHKAATPLNYTIITGDAYSGLRLRVVFKSITHSYPIKSAKD
ncbi:MAG: hypothetical protein V7K89_29295 [Nostoc sp.]|uniref:hypothetical protein n=1 Tax=Nostoc sp. TaxID=1180 RepID=UPI002FF96FD0